MQAGKLRHRITLQQKVVGSPQKKPSGAPDAAWQDLATVWASVEPLRGREFMEAQAVQGKLDVRIRIRYRAGIDATMRALFGATYYYIESVINPESRNKELQLMCSQGVANG